MIGAVREVEPEVLGEPEVKEGVQIKEGHQVSLVPNFYHTERKLRPKEERSHSSSMAASEEKVSQLVEWPGDTRASKHVSTT